MIHLSRNYFKDDIKENSLSKVTQLVSIQSGIIIMFDQILSHGLPMIPWCLPPIPYYKFYLSIFFPDPRACYSPDPLVGGSSSMPNSFHFFPLDLRIQRIQGSTLSSLLEHLL